MLPRSSRSFDEPRQRDVDPVREPASATVQDAFCGRTSSSGSASFQRIPHSARSAASFFAMSSPRSARTTQNWRIGLVTTRLANSRAQPPRRDDAGLDDAPSPRAAVDRGARGRPAVAVEPASRDLVVRVVGDADRVHGVFRFHDDAVSAPELRLSDGLALFVVPQYPREGPRHDRHRQASIATPVHGRGRPAGIDLSASLESTRTSASIVRAETAKGFKNRCCERRNDRRAEGATTSPDVRYDLEGAVRREPGRDAGRRPAVRAYGPEVPNRKLQISINSKYESPKIHGYASPRWTGDSDSALEFRSSNLLEFAA